MQTGEHFLTYVPHAAALHGVVAYYYLHYSDDPNFSGSFVYYPHYRNAVTCYIDVDAEFGPRQSRVVAGRPGSFHSLFSRNYQHSITVALQGPFRKMGIAFEPLGFNHFIQAPLSQMAPQTVSTIQWHEKQLEELMRRVYSRPESDRIATIDEFMLRKYIGFDQPILAKAVQRILQNDGTAGVSEIADEMGVSRKTLLRLFQKHLCCSVEEYKNLVKFRNALNDYRESEAGTTFTELAHKHLYYDQPAFIKHFKSITGLSPRAFFASLQRYGERDTYWTPKI